MRARDLFDDTFFPQGLALPEVLAVSGLTKRQFNHWHERRQLPGDVFKLSPGGWRRYGLQPVWMLRWLRVLTAEGMPVEEAMPLARRLHVRAVLLLVMPFYLPGANGEPIGAQFGDRTPAELRLDRENGAGMFAPDLGFGLWIDYLSTKDMAAGEIELARADRDEALKNAVAATLVCNRPASWGPGEKRIMLPISYSSTPDGIRAWTRSECVETSLTIDHVGVVVDGLTRLEEILAGRSKS
jgi:hypothetical protein